MYKCPDYAGELKKVWNITVTLIPIVSGALGIVPKDLWKKAGGIDDQRKGGNYTDHIIVMII